MRKLFMLSSLAMLIALAVGGCSGGSGGTSADPLGTDTLMFGHKDDSAGASWSSAMDVNASGTVILTALVKNASGVAVPGREVSFGFVSNGSGATLSTTRASTGGDGEAHVIYTAGTVSGLDVVRASISNGATLDTNITVAGGGTGRAVSVTANPSDVAPGSNSYILATVTNGSGNPIVGATVTFTRSVGTGTFATATTVTTDVHGMASVIYTTGNALSQEVVQAAVLSAGIASSAIISKTGAAAGTRSIAVTANPSAVQPLANSMILATVTDSTGSPVAGDAVTFTRSVGTGGFVTSGPVTTDANGHASNAYTTGNDLAEEVVQVSVASGTGTVYAATIITKTGSAPTAKTLSITANPATVQASANSTVMATVLDSSGNPVSGETITFSMVTANGTIVPLTATTDAAGQASIVYTAGNNMLQDVVKATLTNGLAAYTILGRTDQMAGNRISISANPSSLGPTTGTTPAGIVLYSRILVTVTDNSGNPVSGETVTFAMLTANGTLALPVVVTTDTDGKAVAVYQWTATGSLAQDVIRATLLSNGATDVVIMTVW